jgi:hypothetical protein
MERVEGRNAGERGAQWAWPAQPEGEDCTARAGHASPAPRVASVSARCPLRARDVHLQRARAPLGTPRFPARGLQTRNRRGIGRRADAYYARRAQRVGEQQPRACRRLTH